MSRDSNGLGSLGPPHAVQVHALWGVWGKVLLAKRKAEHMQVPCLGTQLHGCWVLQWLTGQALQVRPWLGLCCGAERTGKDSGDDGRKGAEMGWQLHGQPQWTLQPAEARASYGFHRTPTEGRGTSETEGLIQLFGLGQCDASERERASRTIGTSRTGCARVSCHPCDTLRRPQEATGQRGVS